MKAAFEELYKIAERDPGNAVKRVAKILEEGGELTASVLKLEGYKRWKPGDTDETIRANIVEESIDLLQVLGSIWQIYGISTDEIAARFPEKNQKYSDFVRDEYGL